MSAWFSPDLMKLLDGGWGYVLVGIVLTLLADSETQKTNRDVDKGRKVNAALGVVSVVLFRLASIYFFMAAGFAFSDWLMP